MVYVVCVCGVCCECCVYGIYGMCLNYTLSPHKKYTPEHTNNTHLNTHVSSKTRENTKSDFFKNPDVFWGGEFHK